MIKVLRGNPTPEELAAAVTVVRARILAAARGPAAGFSGGHDAAGGPGRRGAPGGPAAWSDPARVARTRLPAPGPHAWERTFRKV